MRRSMLLLILLLCMVSSMPTRADNVFHTGSGNFQAGQVDIEKTMQVLKTAGCDTCRVVCYQNDYGLGDGTPHPERVEPVIVLAEKYGLKPVLLFENYGQTTTGSWGTYESWKATGKAFATKFGARVLCYAAFNEPDGDNPFGASRIDAKLYHDCLAGLSDGVKGVSKSLLVAPGGFCKPNSMSDWTCEKLLPAIADLYNTGKLDVLDIHIYTNGMMAPNSRGPAPLDITYTTAAPQFSCQNAFDNCKKVSGIKSNPYFLTTELNYTSPLDPLDSGRGFLTAFLDAQGVVGDDGATRKTLAALVWQVQALDGARFAALKVAMSLQSALYADLDPSLGSVRRTGMYTMWQKRNGVFCKIYIWHDRPAGWSMLTDVNGGTSVVLPDVPSVTKQIEVYDATGFRPDLSIPVPTDPAATRLQHYRLVTMTGLPADQTLIFIAR